MSEEKGDAMAGEERKKSLSAPRNRMLAVLHNSNDAGGFRVFLRVEALVGCDEMSSVVTAKGSKA